MSSTENQIKELLKVADENMQHGERDKALENLHKALDLDSGNEQVRMQISAIKREIAAMKTFKQTRDRRSHKPEKAMSSSTSFVGECLERSQEAFSAGDEVRALQELERARRHDPDSKEILKRIRIVRRSIKANSIFDLADTKLKSGDTAGALEQARKIFSMWPSSPILEKLLGEIEDSEGIEMEEPEEIDIEDIEELKEIKETETPEPAISPSDIVITSIREKIARSSFADALAEAHKAIRKFPDNTTLKQIIEKLEKITGETEPVPVIARGAPGKKPAAKKPAAKKPAAKKPAAKKPAAKKPAAKKPVAGKTEEKKKIPIGLITGIAVVAVLAVVFFVVKPFGGETQEPEVIEPVAVPYSVSYMVLGSDSPVFMADGETVSRNPDGYFVVSGAGDQTRQIEIRATGYETIRAELMASGGLNRLDTLSLDSVGTSQVQVSFEPRMPEGDTAPEEGQIAWFVDGEEVTGIPVSLPTGNHVFQAVLAGYNSLPESVFVDYSDEIIIQPLALLSQEESQISLSLAGDVPGFANFYIDGALVGQGVRRVMEVYPHGSHSLRISMDGRNEWMRTIELGEAGFSQTVTPIPEETTGRLLIGPEPWAEVFIDGVSQGQTPMPPIELEEGTYSVRLENPDYENQTTTVTIAPGEDASIRYTAEAVEETPEVIEVSEEPVISPFAIQQVSPVTPGLAREHGDLHGYVTLQLIIGTDGRVKSATVLSDELGLGCGQAAVDAALQWVFSPATQGGVPVEVPTTVQVRFDID